MWKSVGVDEETYDKLLKLVSFYIEKKHKMTNLSEIVKDAVDAVFEKEFREDDGK